jgi:hypothetical protein
VAILCAQEAASNHQPIGIRPTAKRKTNPRIFNESEYTSP